MWTEYVFIDFPPNWEGEMETTYYKDKEAELDLKNQSFIHAAKGQFSHRDQIHHVAVTLSSPFTLGLKTHSRKCVCCLLAIWWVMELFQVDNKYVLFV